MRSSRRLLVLILILFTLDLYLKDIILKKSNIQLAQVFHSSVLSVTLNVASLVFELYLICKELKYFHYITFKLMQRYRSCALSLHEQQEVVSNTTTKESMDSLVGSSSHIESECIFDR